MWWLLLMCTASVLGTTTMHPGVIIPSPTVVQFTREMVTVKLDANHLPDAMQQLSDLSVSLAPLQDRINAVNSSLKDHWLWKIQSAHDQLAAVAVFKPVFSNSTQSKKRVKRGMLNIVGKIQSFLFGTVTESEVKEITEQMRKDERMLEDQARLISAQSKLLSQHVAQIEAIVGTVEDLTVRINLLSDKYADLENDLTISVLVDSLYSQITYYLVYFNQLVNNLNLLDKGIVTPTLFGFAELDKILKIAVDLFSFNLAVPMNETEFYYSLIQPEFVDNQIFLHIPFVGRDKFNLYDLIPFPSMVNDTPVVMSDLPDQFLLSESLEWMALPSEAEIDVYCKLVTHKLICKPTIFNFLPLNTSWCPYQIVADKSTLTTCTFKSVVSNTVDRIVLGDTVYYFFPQSQQALVNCPQLEPKAMQVFGRMTVRVDCGMSTPMVHQRSTTDHRVRDVSSHLLHAALIDEAAVNRNYSLPEVMVQKPHVPEAVITADPTWIPLTPPVQRTLIVVLIIAVFVLSVLLGVGLCCVYRKITRQLLPVEVQASFRRPPPRLVHVAA